MKKSNLSLTYKPTQKPTFNSTYKPTPKKTFPWKLLSLILIFAAPFLLATAFYLFRDNIQFKVKLSGQLLTPVLVEDLNLVLPNDSKGKWQLLYLCDAKKEGCAAQYNLLTRLHCLLGKDQKRVILSNPNLSAKTLSDTSSASKLSNKNITLNNIYLIDPRGFLIMVFPLPLENPKAMLEDIRRLLKYSHIG